MRRRKFLGLLAGSAIAWPLAARAHQQAAMPVVGFLRPTAAAGSEPAVRAFRQGLNEAGFVEGQNVGIDYRWADGRYDRLPTLVAELVRQQVAVIFAGGPAAARAARAATETIPIVFTTGDDPVKEGLVASFNRPGGNATGINVVAVELETKRLGLLHELVPAAGTIAALLNPKSPNFATQSKDLQAAARAIGQPIHLMNASTEGEIDAAFAALANQGVVALSVGADPFFSNRREQLVALAARYKVPAIYEWREFAAAGGLMSYGANLNDAHRLAGVYTGRILGGQKPADLPVEQSTKLELIINLKTAKALGLTVPLTLLARADEVIE
jgi:putative ABC transport system substrate-binding protein